ncbi:MAG: putative sterol carrier protein [Natronomonas sp.]|jgi:putative sterol carrier protein|uniref:SCP2 sterol-binding domain-containing protein n=1 Tax=Natronomonas sp. TaxID=2184060 RepID=UPI00398A0E4C
MAYTFPSDEWISEFGDELNENEAYNEKASDWGVSFNGNFIFEVLNDGGLDEDRYFFVGLEAGDCTGAFEVDDPEEVDYGFIFSGEYSDWKRMVQGEVGAIDGMMSGVFDVDGDMQKILQASDAAAELVDTTGRVDTEYIA